MKKWELTQLKQKAKMRETNIRILILVKDLLYRLSCAKSAISSLELKCNFVYLEPKVQLCVIICN